jgi:hypothetical protein
METHRRGSDGRRRFTPEFKRDQLGRVLRGELTMAELSRELSVSHSLVRKWKQLMDHGSETAVGANEDVVPASELRVAHVAPSGGSPTFSLCAANALRDPPTSPPPPRFAGGGRPTAPGRSRAGLDSPPDCGPSVPARARRTGSARR